jgi:class 3 adenylate cyclase
MTFEEILAQVIEVLQRERRMSYRALQRRFDLDNAYLDDVKTELIEAKQLARDENGRILVWAEKAATTAPLPTVPEKPSGSLPADQILREVSAYVAPRVPEAERRQLTMLFCDLADSTRPLAHPLCWVSGSIVMASYGTDTRVSAHQKQCMFPHRARYG